MAPVMLVQVAPLSAERCHWKANVTPTPFHVPTAELSSSPRCGAPEIPGTAVLTGGVAPTAAVTLLGAATVASGLTAVMSRRTRSPTSAVVSV